jgi:hypothetical protein
VERLARELRRRTPRAGLASSSPSVAAALDSALIIRLREVLEHATPTESELRELAEQADGWARSLRGQIRSSERKLRALTADPVGPLTEIAEQLRRVETLRPQLAEVRTLIGELETRAHELRAGWLRAATKS